jgi:predicted deacylase
MHPLKFRLTELPPGRHSLTWDFRSADTALEIPLLIVKGEKPGKTLVVTAGVHGDEYEGVRTILELYRELQPEKMSGTFVASPAANQPAFWNGTRTSPLDDGNLARVFPGRANGSPTEVIAYWIYQKLLPLADLYLDLHSAGVKWLMPTMIGYLESDRAAASAANAFGAPVIWEHPTVSPGRTLSSAIELGIPALYCEARGAGRIHPDDLLIYRRGVTNLLRFLGILDGTPESAAPRVVLCGDGDIDRSINAAQAGFLVPRVELLEHVTKGQELGVLFNLAGEVVQCFHALSDGVVALIQAFPMVQPGDQLFLITGVRA